MATAILTAPPQNFAESDAAINLDERVRWYYSPIDKQRLAQLMQRSDWRGFRQIGLHLLLLSATGAAAWFAWRHQYWGWLALALYLHGTFYGFIGMGTAGHELCHRTVFKTRFWNEFFLWLVSFFGWSNHVAFRTSHVKHHQLTVFNGLDLEVVLPAKIRWRDWWFALTFNPVGFYQSVRTTVRRCCGILEGEWEHRIFPESNPNLRRQLARVSRFVLAAHLALLAAIIWFKLWILLLLVTLAPFYAGWLQFLCGVPQHAGLPSSVPDFRLCCRTMILSRFTSFLYWQMNYHIEHHMYAAVPFFRLRELRREIESDLPPAPRGLWATWKELLPILRRQRTDPTCVFLPQLPTQVIPQSHECYRPANTELRPA